MQLIMRLSASAAATSPQLSDCVWAHAAVPSGLQPWWMCTYHRVFDVWVSRRIQIRRCFECETVGAMLYVLNRAMKRAHLRRRSCTGLTEDLAQMRLPLLVDVGANIGMYSLAAAASCFEAIAFEPVPMNAHKMVTSARTNNMTGWLHVYTVGASDAYATFSLGDSKNNQGSATQSQTGGGEDGLMRVPVAPLSQLLPSQPAERPVFVKIDVEGGECRAIRGMMDFLRRSRIIGMLVETGQSETR